MSLVVEKNSHKKGRSIAAPFQDVKLSDSNSDSEFNVHHYNKYLDYRNYKFFDLEDAKEIIFENYCGPTPESNWVIPGLLLVGAYPASEDDNETFDLLTSILVHGVKKFVCLQHEYHHHVPEHLWRMGHALRPYFEDIKILVSNKSSIGKLKGNNKVVDMSELEFEHFPIIDCGISDDERVLELARNLVNDLGQGKTMYLHCWGGHGRTGTLVCIMLHIMYGLSAEECMKRCQLVHDLRHWPVAVDSPQTKSQKDQVKRIIKKLKKMFKEEEKLKPPPQQKNYNNLQPKAENSQSPNYSDSFPKTDNYLNSVRDHKVESYNIDDKNNSKDDLTAKVQEQIETQIEVKASTSANEGSFQIECEFLAVIQESTNNNLQLEDTDIKSQPDLQEESSSPNLPSLDPTKSFIHEKNDAQDPTNIKDVSLSSCSHPFKPLIKEKNYYPKALKSSSNASKDLYKANALAHPHHGRHSAPDGVGATKHSLSHQITDDPNEHISLASDQANSFADFNNISNGEVNGSKNADENRNGLPNTSQPTSTPLNLDYSSIGQLAISDQTRKNSNQNVDNCPKELVDNISHDKYLNQPFNATSSSSVALPDSSTQNEVEANSSNMELGTPLGSPYIDQPRLKSMSLDQPTSTKQSTEINQIKPHQLSESQSLESQSHSLEAYTSDEGQDEQVRVATYTDDIYTKNLDKDPSSSLPNNSIKSNFEFSVQKALSDAKKLIAYSFNSNPNMETTQNKPLQPDDQTLTLKNSHPQPQLMPTPPKNGLPSSKKSQSLLSGRRIDKAKN